jgi:Restriction endonuclease
MAFSFLASEQETLMTPASDKWRHFERLVAAVHRAADQGAEIRWNETIHGRQFDVTIRFRKGLYEYLTVVECKNHQKAVPVEKVEAFVTKAADAKAHHAVMASTSGFQEGAQEVALRHNMTLVHVTESLDIDLSILGARWGNITDALHVESIELEYADGERKKLPKEAHAMTYYVNQILIQCGPAQRTLDDLIQGYLQQFPVGGIDAYRDHAYACPAGTRVIGPDDTEVPLKPLAYVHVRAGTTRARTITGPVMFDPYLLVPDVTIRDLATGEKKHFSQHGLALGVNTQFVEGRFYEQPTLATYYYCDSINDGVAHLYLVECYQLGNLIQAEFTTKTEYAKFYVPVSDNAITQRLQRRLEHLKARQTKG